MLPLELSFQSVTQIRKEKEKKNAFFLKKSCKDYKSLYICTRKRE